MVQNKYLKYLKGPLQENWQQALDRFALFCANLKSFDYDGEVYEANFDTYYQDGTLLERPAPVEPSLLLRAETRFALSMPESLKMLFAKPFLIYDVSIRFGRWGERLLTDINSAKEHFDCLHPFTKAIAWNFLDHFATTELSKEQIAQLDANYFGFGRWSNEDGQGTYLLMDRQGGFGKYEFDSEDYPENLKRIEKLLQSPLTMTLDQLLVWAIDASMEALLLRNEIPSLTPDE